MKLLLCVLAVMFSYIAALNKEQKCKSMLESNKILCEIAEKIKENHIYSVIPITDIISEIALEHGITITKFDDFSSFTDKFSSFFSNAIGFDEIYEQMINTSSAILSNIDEKCDLLCKLTAKNYELASLKYEKCKKTVFYVYPGITTIIAIVLL